MLLVHKCKCKFECCSIQLHFYGCLVQICGFSHFCAAPPPFYYQSSHRHEMVDLYFSPAFYIFHFTLHSCVYGIEITWLSRPCSYSPSDVATFTLAELVVSWNGHKYSIFQHTLHLHLTCGDFLLHLPERGRIITQLPLISRCLLYIALVMVICWCLKRMGEKLIIRVFWPGIGWKRHFSFKFNWYEAWLWYLILVSPFLGIFPKLLMIDSTHPRSSHIAGEQNS